MSRRETRILVVEDDETLRETLTEVLADEGHEVRVAASAQMVVISASRDIEDASERLEAAAWIPKPFLLDEVIDTVDRLLETSA